MNDRLQKIRAKCVELLEIASKRTPGRWEARHNHESIIGPRYQVMAAEPDNWYLAINGLGPDMAPCDASFVASCAGPAEAGWRATIAAIDGLTCKTCCDAGWTIGYALSQAEAPEQIQCRDCPDPCAVQEIITAWEGIEL